LYEIGAVACNLKTRYEPKVIGVELLNSVPAFRLLGVNAVVEGENRTALTELTPPPVEYPNENDELHAARADKLTEPGEVKSLGINGFTTDVPNVAFAPLTLTAVKVGTVAFALLMPINEIPEAISKTAVLIEINFLIMM
jgi:hypothetical protein